MINEYLDESHAPHFMPDTPLERANDRMWSDFVTGLYGDVYRGYNAEDEEAANQAFDGIRNRLARLEEEVTGPLFRGDHFTLIDATAAPPFTRLEWMERIIPEADFFADTPKAKGWKEALLSRESVKNSVLPNLYDIFTERLQGGSSWLGSRL
ncbi:MAG: glutathione binding-like protein [Chloroflexota bacterium]